MHGALDDSVRRLRIHHVQQNVNHFIAPDSENRGAENLFRFCINADFDETLCLAFFVGPAHLTHRIFRSQGAMSGQTSGASEQWVRIRRDASQPLARGR